MKINKIIKKEKGFTLVEALISIAILMISVAAPLSIAASGLLSAKIAEKQIVATYLAQDMIESIINIKASNKIKNYNEAGAIIAGLRFCDVDDLGSNGCYMDTISQNINSCASASCAASKLNFYEDSGTYAYTGTGSFYSSGFKRVAKIKKVSSAAGEVEEILVTVEVIWPSTNGSEQKYILEDRLTNW